MNMHGSSLSELSFELIINVNVKLSYYIHVRIYISYISIYIYSRTYVSELYSWKMVL